MDAYFLMKVPGIKKKIIKEGDKRRGINYLDIVNKKKQSMEDLDNDLDEEEEEEFEEKKNIEDLNDNIINNQNIINNDELKGPNDI